MTSNGAYSHRTHSLGVRPTVQSSTRVADALDSIKQEFELLQADRDALRVQRDEFEAQVNAQINEVNGIRRSLYDLEIQQGKVRQHYEEEVRRLRAEIATLRQAAGPPIVPPGIPGFQPLTLPGAPRVGPAPSSLSGSFARERENDRTKEKPRMPTSPAAETDWELRPKTRDSRDIDRIGDVREPKRLKHESGSTAAEPASTRDPDTSGNLPPPHTLYSPAGSATALRPPGRDSAEYQVTLPPINTNSQTFPEELSLSTVPPEYRKEGSDWFAVFNPRVKRSLDITLVHTLIHASVVCCVQFSADGKYVATGCNKTAQIYDVKTGAKICVLSDDSAGKSGDLYIRSVRFSPDGKLLATGAEDRQIRIWDIAKNRIRNIFEGHQQEIYSLDFSKDGRLIVSGSGDKTARIWDTNDGSCKVLTINDQDSLNSDAGVTSVAISPNGQFVAAGSLDTIVRIWDVATGTLLERLRGHRDSVYSVAFTPDGNGLISGSLDKTLKYWDVSAVMGAAAIKGRRDPASDSPPKKSGDKPNVSPCTMDFVGHKDYVLSVSVSHDGQWVVSGSKDRCVQFWDSRNAALQFMLQGHKNSVISLDVNPAGGLLATGSGDSLARIWRYSTI
ncbi:putative anaphase-promoting complex subunit 4 WD40 domain [Lyophyllum shimeji]|uniref:Anaphase-promoting complex subunit 4 WD40 domain n=1 Tax=Lyophyllum shimeji TaxID=47721 RepID=A0A9P3Q133_LYOSH|nr:putative anaphase-promoting complex subunit 4 WD40 domain [Lyophyllum shimeji]